MPSRTLSGAFRNAVWYRAALRSATTAVIHGLSLVLVLILCVTEAGRAQFSRIITFENRTVGAYTATMMKEDFRPPAGATWNNGLDEGRARIETGDKAFAGKGLEIKFIGAQFGPAPGGVQFYSGITAADEMYVTYRLRFAADFDFVKGGKLPGLCGGACNSGGEKPTGTDGWSARYMFRENGKAVLYLYHMDQPTEFGQDLALRPDNQQAYFERGRWYVIRQRIKMNTPGQANGIAQVWIDGKIALNRQDLRFRTTTNLKVDAFFFSTFYGGSDATWAPPRDQFAFFDNIEIQSEVASSGLSSSREAGRGSHLDISQNREGLSISGTRPIGRVRLLDLRGRVLAQREASGGPDRSASLALPAKAPGVCLVQVTTGGENVTRRAPIFGGRE